MKELLGGQSAHPFSASARPAIREQIGQAIFDLVIIGGGINGVAIARDAALRGYRVALVEQGDFGSGTSSRSSRLVHGGLRYLEYGELALVFEGVSERAVLANMARHLVRPMPFIAPVHKGDPYALPLVDLGLWIYDLLALFRNYRVHSRLTRDRLIRDVPGINETGLKGGVLYYDYQTNDARLVVENAVAAVDAGALLLPYCRANRFEYCKGRARSVLVSDLRSGDSIEIQGRAFVCAAGPWTDDVLEMTHRPVRWIRSSKGVHLVLPKEKLSVPAALVIRHPEDGRVLFILPYHEHTVVGTTDTDYDDDPAQADTSADDIAYLFAAAEHYFPGTRLEKSDIIASWSGIRPLVAQEDADSPSDISRAHRLTMRSDGIAIIAGGKLTTNRLMAEECVDLIEPAIGRQGGTLPRSGCVTKSQPLPGGRGLNHDDDLNALAAQLDQRISARDSSRTKAERQTVALTSGAYLASTYGVRAPRILAIAAEIPEGVTRLDAALPYLWAEIPFIVREEMPTTLEDLLVRRMDLFYRARDRGRSIAGKVAQMMGSELGWPAERVSAEVGAYITMLDRSQL